MTPGATAQLLTVSRIRTDSNRMDNTELPGTGTANSRGRRAMTGIFPLALASLLATWHAQADDATLTRMESIRSCDSAARLRQRINLSSGVYTERAVASSPLYLEIPVGSDGRVYADCLQRTGFSPDDQVTAEFARVAACNDTAIRHVVLKRRSSRNVRIGSKIDAAAYARCVDTGVTVEAEIAPVPE